MKYKTKLLFFFFFVSMQTYASTKSNSDFYSTILTTTIKLIYFSIYKINCLKFLKNEKKKPKKQQQQNQNKIRY